MSSLSFEELKDLEKLKHEQRLEQLKFERGTLNMKHSQDMELHRIRRADKIKAAERDHYFRIKEIEHKDNLIRGAKR